MAILKSSVKATLSPAHKHFLTSSINANLISHYLYAKPETANKHVLCHPHPQGAAEVPLHPLSLSRGGLPVLKRFKNFPDLTRIWGQRGFGRELCVWGNTMLIGRCCSSQLRQTASHLLHTLSAQIKSVSGSLKMWTSAACIGTFSKYQNGLLAFI